MKASETQLVYSCLEYLALKKIFAWRANSGSMSVESSSGKKRFIRFAGVDGLADIIGVLPDGRFLAVECKMPGRHPKPAQIEFARRITAAGGVALLIYSLDELISALGSLSTDLWVEAIKRKAAARNA